MNNCSNGSCGIIRGNDCNLCLDNKKYKDSLITILTHLIKIDSVDMAQINESIATLTEMLTNLENTLTALEIRVTDIEKN